MKKKFIFLAVLAVFVLSAISCARRDRLHIFNWAYYTPEAVIKQFEKEYNVRVIVDLFGSNEEMFARIRTGGTGFDIVFPTQDYVEIMMRLGMLERLDHSLIPNLKNICPHVLERAIYDPNMNYSVPYFWGAPGIIVNTARVPDFEKCWSIFARTDLRGRMTKLDDLREVIGNALVYLGFSINTTNPEEVFAARDFINTYWRPNLARFDGLTYGAGFANGEFWVVHGYAEDVFLEIYDNEELMRDTVFFIPPEGGSAFIDSMVILRGSRNVELAHKFINFIHRPEIYAQFVDDFGFPASVNVPARELTRGFMGTGRTWYTFEDLIHLELKYDLGEALRYYHDAWFNSIRVGN